MFTLSRIWKTLSIGILFAFCLHHIKWDIDFPMLWEYRIQYRDHEIATSNWCNQSDRDHPVSGQNVRSQDTRKNNNVVVHHDKTEIGLGISSGCSEFSLSAWRNRGSLVAHCAYSEDSDQTGWMPRLIFVFALRLHIWLILLCHHQFIQ